MLNNKSVLVTGGTGSFGKKFVDIVLQRYKPARLIIFSRDELKQYEMQSKYPEKTDSPIRYFLGDVRDRDRLYRAFEGVDVIVHAAALKQVPASEYNPLETIKTNILGAANVIDAAIDRNVSKVVALSTDKACSPINIYGATKLCSDKLFTAARTYSGHHQTQFVVVRYGNVINSRGSVVPLFRELKKTGKIPITHEDMTRFVCTLERSVNFVIEAIIGGASGNIYIPKLPSVKILDLAKSLAPDCEIEIVGIRPGEKLHETLISREDADRTLEFDDSYVIQPYFLMHIDDKKVYKGGRKCKEGFEYRSDTNNRILKNQEIGDYLNSEKAMGSDAS